MKTALSPEIVTTPFGDFYCDPHGDSKMFERLRGFGITAELESEFIRTFVRPGDTIIDVGAHIGTFSVPFARAAGPQGKVYAIEPNAASLELLKRNITLNRTESIVEARQCVLSSSPEALYPHEVSTGNRGSLQYRKGRGMPGGIESVTLDALIPKEGRKINVMKIDVEGMECEVLRGARELLARDHPLLHIEVNAAALRAQGHGVLEMGNILKGHGYRFYKQRSWEYETSHVYRLARLPSLLLGGPFYDLVAIHPSDSRFPENPDSFFSTVADAAARRIRAMLTSFRKL